MKRHIESRRRQLSGSVSRTNYRRAARSCAVRGAVQPDVGGSTGFRRVSISFRRSGVIGLRSISAQMNCCLAQVIPAWRAMRTAAAAVRPPQCCPALLGLWDDERRPHRTTGRRAPFSLLLFALLLSSPTTSMAMVIVGSIVTFIMKHLVLL